MAGAAGRTGPLAAPAEGREIEGRTPPGLQAGQLRGGGKDEAAYRMAEVADPGEKAASTVGEVFPEWRDDSLEFLNIIIF